MNNINEILNYKYIFLKLLGLNHIYNPTKPINLIRYTNKENNNFVTIIYNHKADILNINIVYLLTHNINLTFHVNSLDIKLDNTYIIQNDILPALNFKSSNTVNHLRILIYFIFNILLKNYKFKKSYYEYNENDNFYMFLSQFPGLENITETEFIPFINFLESIPGFHTGNPKITYSKNNKPLCLHCNTQESVASHSISESVLKQISSKDNYLYSFNNYWYLFKCLVGFNKKISHYSNFNENFTLKSISCGQASRYDGFCADDDKLLFKGLEQGERNRENTMLSLLYRTIGYKIRFMEEQLNLDTAILEYTINNPSFFKIWKNLFLGTPLAELINYYSSSLKIQAQISYLNDFIYVLKKEFAHVKNIYINNTLFNNEYYWHIEEETTIEYLGINYIQYSDNYSNTEHINNIGGDLLIGAMIVPNKPSSSKNSYKFFKFALVKKENEFNLKTLLKNININELCYQLLIRNDAENRNTFFARTATKNNSNLINQEIQNITSKYNLL